MATNDSPLRRRFGAVMLALAAAAWTWVALRAATPLLPDEYAYFLAGVEIDRLARAHELAPTVPQVTNVLFLRLIDLISRAHLPVELVIKLINIAAFVGSAALLGRLVLPIGAFWRAAAIFAVIAFHPTATYVGMIMPESLYLLGFTLLFWLFARSGGGGLNRLWAGAGAILAAMVLLKAHGYFALAAFVAATLGWALATGKISVLTALRLCLLTAAVFVVTLLAGKALVGPKDGASDTVGGFYWAIVGNASFSANRLLVAATSAASQLAGVLTLFAPSLAFVAWGVAAERRGSGDPARENLFSFLALFLIFAVGAVVAASSYLLVVDHNRLLLRYATFVFPCLLALAWIWTRHRPELETRRFRLLAAGLWLAGAAVFAWRLPELRPLSADAPELFFSYFSGEMGAFGLGAWARGFSLAVVAAGALAMLHPRLRWIDCQVAVLIVLFAVANANTIRWQGLWSAPRAPVWALGQAAKTLCPEDEAGIVVIASIYQLEQVYPALIGVGRAVPLERSHSPSMKRLTAPAGSCILTTHVLDDTLGPPLAVREPLRLYRTGLAPSPPWREIAAVRFDEGRRPAELGAGWAAPEPEWIYTEGRSANLNIRRPTAGPLLVELQGSGFKLDQRVEVFVDGQKAAFWHVHEGSYRVTLPVGEAGSVVEVRLGLPDAASFAEIEPGNPDRRLLGLAVRRLTIYAPST